MTTPRTTKNPRGVPFGEISHGSKSSSGWSRNRSVVSRLLLFGVDEVFGLLSCARVGQSTLKMSNMEPAKHKTCLCIVPETTGVIGLSLFGLSSKQPQRKSDSPSKQHTQIQMLPRRLTWNPTTRLLEESPVGNWTPSGGVTRM